MHWLYVFIYLASSSNQMTFWCALIVSPLVIQGRFVSVVGVTQVSEWDGLVSVGIKKSMVLTPGRLFSAYDKSVADEHFQGPGQRLALTF